MPEISNEEKLSEAATSYRIKIDPGELDSSETPEQSYHRYRDQLQKARRASEDTAQSTASIYTT